MHSDPTNSATDEVFCIYQLLKKHRSAMGKYRVSLKSLGKPMIQLGEKYKEHAPGNIVVLNHLHTFSMVSPW